MQRALEDIEAKELVMVQPVRVTPLGFPLWAESIRSTTVSSERWEDRVKRMIDAMEEERAS